MKCAKPDCIRGIGLVSYQRGWFSKAALLFKKLPRCVGDRSPETATRTGRHDIFRVAFLRSIENSKLKGDARHKRATGFRLTPVGWNPLTLHKAASANSSTAPRSRSRPAQESG